MSTSVVTPIRSSSPGEAPYTLVDPPPRTLGFGDQFSLWGNLAVSLTLPVLAPFLMPAGSSLAASVVAVLVGALLGSLVLGLTAVPGAATGAPAMVVLRGLLGAKVSYVPTLLNIAQCIGWAVVEVIVIAEAATALTTPKLRWVFVILAGAAATALALYPLAFVKRLRKIAVWLVLLASAYLFVRVVAHGVGSWSGGNWSNFWPAVDLVVGLAVSWAPLASDYSRHSRSRGAAFGGAFAGYASGAVLYLLLGVFALAGMSDKNADVSSALLAFAGAGFALAILAVDEVDEAFANIYSTAISVQNLAPRLDRRVLAILIGVVATGIGLIANMDNYKNFLYLIGAVFVPLSAVLIVAFFTQRSAWDVTESAPPRPWLLVPWVLGFASYQLIFPTPISAWWVERWTALQSAIAFTPQPWMSASLCSFGLAAVVTLIVLRFDGRRAAP